MTSSSPSSEAKFWAVLSHLSILAGGIGLIIPAYGWAENRQKSSYAAFQSLQALGYQSLGYTLWALAYLLVFIILSIATFPFLPKDPQDSPALSLWLGVHAFVAVVLFGIYILFPLIGAVMCALGRDFRYPLLGNRLARYAGFVAGSPQTPLDELHADRFAVSMGHFCVIFPLLGLLVPFALWTTQGKRSRYMEFQALQTIVFQALGTLVFAVLGVIAFIILVVTLIPFILALNNAGQFPIEGLFGVFIFLICLAVIVLVVPLFQILGQWAGLRVLQGRDYRYPLLGRFVEKRMARRDAPAQP
jgi:uncharacterized Tic20 family protein